MVDTQHTIPAATYVQQMPDHQGRFGRFGGQFAPETLLPAIAELSEARNDPAFQVEIDHLAAQYVGRPTPLYEAERFSAEVSGNSGTRIFFKREDLAHTGAHKINNALGQTLLGFPSPLPSNSLGIPGFDEKFVDLSTVVRSRGNFHERCRRSGCNARTDRPGKRIDQP